MAVLRLALNAAALAAVAFMSAWVAHICLRRRPDWITIVINLSFWIIPVALLMAVTGQPLKSFGLGTAIVFVLQRLHWLKWKFMANTLTVVDLRMILARANWLVVRMYPYLAGFAAVCLVGLTLSWLLVPATSPLGWRARVVALLVGAGLIAFDVRFRNWHEFDPFGFNTYGHFANLLFATSSLGYRPPAVAGDSGLFLERAAKLAAPPVVQWSRPPDIVVWLQESATDPRIFDVPGARLPALAMHQPDARTRDGGWLRVPTWGGSTWLSEFALLTGLSHEDFGAAAQGVFYSVTPHLRFSLPRLLRTQGYRCVALYPLEKTFYNAESAYRDLGFDEVLTPLDFPEWGNKSLATIVEDRDLFSFALQILSRSTTQPVFLYMLSMIQHGPYDALHAPGFGLEHSRLDQATVGRLSDWLGRMQRLSDDTMDFDRALQASGREPILTYFGDHQPNLEGDVAMASGLDDPRFLTRFAIKGPGEAPNHAGSNQVLDLCFLGSLILEHAGIPRDEFFAASLAMRQLCGGTLRGCSDAALRTSYRAYLYRDLAAASS